MYPTTAREGMTDDEAAVYDWLAANGVDEWIPENPDFLIADGQLTYSAWEWAGPRGWDMTNIAADAEGALKQTKRTVPLLIPPDDRIRHLISDTGCTLVER